MPVRRHRDPIVWTNAAYAFAAVPYLAGSYLSGPEAILALLVALSLMMLTVGSWVFHVRSTPGHNHRAGHVLDHIGMHASFVSLAAYTCTSAYDLGNHGLVLFGVLAFVSMETLHDPDSGDKVTLRHSYPAVGFFGAVALVGLLKLDPVLALRVACLFAASFLFRHRDPAKASGFGWRHAIWHVVTAWAFARASGVS